MFLPSLLLIAVATAAPGSANAQNEMLRINAPDEFEVGYRARNLEQEMIELVQRPEKVDTWSELITLQLFFDGARRDSADAFYARWRKLMRTSCAGMTDTAVTGSVDGKPAIRSQLACPLNPQTGKSENLVAVLVQGGANLMMVQVAFRRPITAEDRALIARITGSLKVCDQRSLSECSARKASGFVTSRK